MLMLFATVLRSRWLEWCYSRCLRLNTSYPRGIVHLPGHVVVGAGLNGVVVVVRLCVAIC